MAITQTALRFREPALAPADTGRPAVLIVDPDHSARGVLAAVLSQDGFEVLAVVSALEAQGALRAGFVPRLAVIASSVGAEDGFSFCAQLKGEPKTDRVPVILVAHREGSNIEELSKVVGADDFVLKPAFARDISALVQLNLAPRRPDGSRLLAVKTVKPAHLLRALISGGHSGRLVLQRARGKISFRAGQVVAAEFDGVVGLDALVRALALAQGDFAVMLEPVASVTSMELRAREWVSQVMPRLAKWEQLLQRSVPLDACLALDFNKLAQSLSQIPSAVSGVIQLFDGLRDLRTVLLDSPLNEVITLEVANRLYLMNVIGAAVAQAAPSVADSVKLFEPKAQEADERMNELFSGAADEAPAAAASADDDWASFDGAGPAQLDGTEGWQTSRLAELPDDVARQLAAFDIQPVVEPQAPAPAEVRAFARGATVKPLLLTQVAQVQTKTPVDVATVARVPTLSAWMAQASSAAGLAVEPEEKTAPQALLLESRGPLPRVETKIEKTLAPLLGEEEIEKAFFEPSGEEAAPEAVAVAGASEALLSDGSSLLDVESEQVANPHPVRLTQAWVLWVIAPFVAAVLLTAWQLNRQANASEPEAVVVAAALPPAAVQAVAPLEVVAPAFDSDGALVKAHALYDSGKLKESIAVLEEVVTHDSASAQAWLLMGLARFDSGDVSGAAEAANTALTLEPNTARAHLLLASMYISAKNRDAAQAEIQRYLQLEPNGPFADEARSLMR